MSSQTVDVPSLPFLPSVNVKQDQKNDDFIREWIYWVKEHRKPAKEQLERSPHNTWFINNFEKLQLVDGVLYREILVDQEPLKQLVLPESCIQKVLESLHDEMGHQGKEKTLSLVRDRFIWYGMTRDVEKWIDNCDRCLHRKKVPKDKAPLINIETYQPLELVCMDYLSLERSAGGYENILIITDHFTRYALAVPTKNQTARTTAEAFFNNFVVHYGLPKRKHSDQGANFQSKIIKELCQITGMEKSRTTPYHPMGNGLTERFNRTLLNMLGTLQNAQKKNWKSHVAGLVHAYNCTRQTTTGFSPYFLMFGRQPHLPVDLAFGLDDDTKQPSTKYVDEMKDRLKKAYDLAARSIMTAQGRQKEGYDRRARGAILQPGDRVLVKRVAFDGKHKLADKWEEDTYRIVRQPNDAIPVYVVQKENGEGKKKTLHRNLLLPIGHLPEEEKEKKPAPRKSLPRKTLDVPMKSRGSIQETETSTDEESEQGYYYLRLPRRHAQSDTNRDAEPVVERQQGTIDLYDDDRTRVNGGQGTSSGEDALPSEEDTDEQLNLDADVITGDVAAHHGSREDTSGDEDDSSLPDTSGEAEADAEAPVTPHQPRRRRRMLPTPPTEILETKRVRRPPPYLTEHYVMKQAIGKPPWYEKVEWLKTQLREGVFKGMEMEISRTIMEIVKKS